MKESATEKDLVSLSQGGDEVAFSTLLEATLPKVRRLLLRQYPLQDADVDDIIQNASIKAWNKVSTFRSAAAFATWFYFILKNEAVDFLKARARLESKEISVQTIYPEEGEENYERFVHEMALEQPLEETASSILEHKELVAFYRKMIQEVFDSLSPDHGQIMDMALEKEEQYRDISKELDVPIGTVMSRLFYARKKARNLIIDYARKNAIQLPSLGRRK